MMMDAKLKRKWVKALRSGEYRQGRGLLVSNSGKSFCCLGVLADIQGCVWGTDAWGNLIPFLPKSEKPLSRYGSDMLSPRLGAGGLSKTRQGKLAEMNDSNKTFKEIADYIEKNIGWS